MDRLKILKNFIFDRKPIVIYVDQFDYYGRKYIKKKKNTFILECTKICIEFDIDMLKHAKYKLYRLHRNNSNREHCCLKLHLDV